MSIYIRIKNDFCIKTYNLEREGLDYLNLIQNMIGIVI